MKEERTLKVKRILKKIVYEGRKKKKRGKRWKKREKKKVTEVNEEGGKLE